MFETPLFEWAGRSFGISSSTQLNSDLAILYKLSGGTSIPSGANLNDYKVPGNYYCNANVTVLTLLNIPSNLVSAFTLKVEYGTGIGYPCQTIRNFHTGDFYYRVYDTFNQFWGVWYVFKGTKV